MALEKTKKDKLDIPETIKKTKRNKHPTTCHAKTKMNKDYMYCPFCGSENLVMHGVMWSDEVPDKDEHFITAERWFLWGSNRLAVHACSDCGAVNSGRCPNCDKDAGIITIRSNYINWQRHAWRNNIGKLICTKCSFRGGMK